MLGAFPGASYESAALHLAPGDSLVLFTDGVTEALNAADELYEDDRLVACLAQLRGAAPAEIVAAVLADVNRFAAGAPQADDTTLLAIAGPPGQRGCRREAGAGRLRLAHLAAADMHKPARLHVLPPSAAPLRPAVKTAAASAAATRSEVGRPFLTCFGSREYGATARTGSSPRTRAGLMYVGEHIGALEYDGASWRLIETASNSVVRVDHPRLAMGACTLAAPVKSAISRPMRNGSCRYVSLLQHVKPEDRAFNDVWTAHVAAEGVDFQSRELLLLLTPPADPAADTGWRVRTWKPRGLFLFAFAVGGTYDVHEQSVGLQRMVGDRLVLVPGSEQFAQERVQVLLPLDDGARRSCCSGRSIAVCSVRRRDVHAVRDRRGRVPARADAVQRRRAPGRNLRLLDDQRRPRRREPGGHALHYINQATGLPNDNTLGGVRRSHRAGVAGLRRSVCQVETPSPVSRFDITSGWEAASPIWSGTRACCMPPPASGCSIWTHPRPPSNRSPAFARATRRRPAWRRTATC